MLDADPQKAMLAGHNAVVQPAVVLMVLLLVID
jgi:hypothetical protein